MNTPVDFYVSADVKRFDEYGMELLIFKKGKKYMGFEQFGGSVYSTNGEVKGGYSVPFEQLATVWKIPRHGSRW